MGSEHCSDGQRLPASAFIHRSGLGVPERLLTLVQKRGVWLGMTFLDGTAIPAQHEGSGGSQNGVTALERGDRECLDGSEAVLRTAAASTPKFSRSPALGASPSPSCLASKQTHKLLKDYIPVEGV